MTATGRKYVRTRKIGARELGLNAVTLAATRTSAKFDCSTFNQISIDVNLSSQNTVTRVDIYLEHSNDGGTTWIRPQSAAIAGGAATLSDLVYRKTVAAADQWGINFPINYTICQLVVAVGAGTGTATDIISVDITLGA
jgi:hypothetical protein